MTYGQISMFAACTMLLRVYQEILVTTFHCSYRNYENICNKSTPPAVFGDIMCLSEVYLGSEDDDDGDGRYTGRVHDGLWCVIDSAPRKGQSEVSFNSPNVASPPPLFFKRRVFLLGGNPRGHAYILPTCTPYMFVSSDLFGKPAIFT